MSEIIADIRDRPNRVGRTTWRWVIIYLSAGAVLLEVLDVFSERLGLPNRFFLLMAIGILLLLPGVAGAGALRGMAEEEGEDVAARPGRPARSIGKPVPVSGGQAAGASDPAPRSASLPDPAPRSAGLPDPAPRSAGLSDPAPRSEEMAELHYRLGRFYEERGDSARAAHHYEKSLEGDTGTGS